MCLIPPKLQSSISYISHQRWFWDRCIRYPQSISASILQISSLNSTTGNFHFRFALDVSFIASKNFWTTTPQTCNSLSRVMCSTANRVRPHSIGTIRSKGSIRSESKRTQSKRKGHCAWPFVERWHFECVREVRLWDDKRCILRSSTKDLSAQFEGKLGVAEGGDGCHVDLGVSWLGESIYDEPKSGVPDEIYNHKHKACPTLI